MRTIEETAPSIQSPPNIRRGGQSHPGTDEVLYRNDNYTNHEVSSQSESERFESSGNMTHSHGEMTYYLNAISTCVSIVDSCSMYNELYSTQYTEIDTDLYASTVGLRRRQNSLNIKSKSECENYESVQRRADVLRFKVKDVMSAPYIPTKIHTLSKKVKRLRTKCCDHEPTVEINLPVEKPLTSNRRSYSKLKNIIKLGGQKIKLSKIVLLRHIEGIVRRSSQKRNISDNVTTLEQNSISVKKSNKSVQCIDFLVTTSSTFSSENNCEVTLKPGDADDPVVDFLDNNIQNGNLNIKKINDDNLRNISSKKCSSETITVFKNGNSCASFSHDVDTYWSTMHFSSKSIPSIPYVNKVKSVIDLICLTDIQELTNQDENSASWSNMLLMIPDKKSTTQCQPGVTEYSHERKPSESDTVASQSGVTNTSLMKAYYPDLISIQSHDSTLSTENPEDSTIIISRQKSSSGDDFAFREKRDFHYRQSYYMMNVSIRRRRKLKESKKIRKTKADFDSYITKQVRECKPKQQNRPKKRVRFLKTSVTLPNDDENKCILETPTNTNPKIEITENVTKLLQNSQDLMHDFENDLLSYLCALGNQDYLKYENLPKKTEYEEKFAELSLSEPNFRKKHERKKTENFSNSNKMITKLPKHKSDKNCLRTNKRKEPYAKNRFWFRNLFTSSKLTILRKQSNSKIKYVGNKNPQAKNKRSKNVSRSQEKHQSSEHSVLTKLMKSTNKGAKEKKTIRIKSRKRTKPVRSKVKKVKEHDKRLVKTKERRLIDTNELEILLASIFADPTVTVNKETNQDIQNKVSKSTNTKTANNKSSTKKSGRITSCKSDSAYKNKRNSKESTRKFKKSKIKCNKMMKFENKFSIFRVSKQVLSYFTSKITPKEYRKQANKPLKNKKRVKKENFKSTIVQSNKTIFSTVKSSKHISLKKRNASLKMNRANKGTHHANTKKIRKNVEKEANTTFRFKKIFYALRFSKIANGFFLKTNKKTRSHKSKVSKRHFDSECVNHTTRITPNNATDIFGPSDEQNIPYICRKCDAENKRTLTKVSQSTSTKRRKKKHHRRYKSDPFKYVPDSIDPMICSLKLEQKKPKYIFKPDAKKDREQEGQEALGGGPCGMNFESSFSFDISLNKGLNRLQAGKQVQQAAELMKENRQTCRDTNYMTQSLQRSELKMTRTTATNISLDPRKLQFLECRPSQTDLSLKPCICSLKLHDAESQSKGKNTGMVTHTIPRGSAVTLSATQTPTTKSPFLFLGCPGPTLKRCLCAKFKKPTKSKSSNTKVQKTPKKSECECTQTEDIKTSVGIQDSEEIVPPGAIECKPGSCVPNKCDPFKCELKLGKKPCNLPLLRSQSYSYTGANLISMKGKGTGTYLPLLHSKSTIAKCQTKSKLVPAAKPKNKKTQQCLNIITNLQDSKKNKKSRKVQQGGTLTLPKTKWATHSTNTKITKTKNEKIKQESKAKEKKIQVNENKKYAPTYKGVGIGTRSNDSVGMKIDSQIKLKIEFFKKNNEPQSGDSRRKDLDGEVDKSPEKLNGKNAKMQTSTKKVEEDIDIKECKIKTAEDKSSRKDAGDFKSSKSCSCGGKSQSTKSNKKMQKKCSCIVNTPKTEIRKPCKCDINNDGLKKSKLKDCDCTLKDKEDAKKLIKNCICQTNPLNKKSKKPCKCKLKEGEPSLDGQPAILDSCKCTLKDKEQFKKLIKHCKCQTNPLNKNAKPCRCKLINANDIVTKHPVLENCTCTLKEIENAKRLRKNCKCQTKRTKKPCKCKALIEGDLDANNIELGDCKCSIKEREKIKKIIKKCECKNNPLNQEALKPCKCKLDKNDENEQALAGLKKSKLENCMCTLKDLANAKKLLKNCLCKIKKPCVCNVIKIGGKDVKKPESEECKCTLQGKENVKKLINNCMCKNNPLNKKEKKTCKCKLGEGDRHLKKSQLEACDCTLKDKEDAKKLVKNCICQTNPLNKKSKRPCKCKLKEGDSSLDGQPPILDDCKCTLKDQEKFKKHIKHCKCQTNPLNKNAKPCRCKLIKEGDINAKNLILENCRCTSKDIENAKKQRKNCKCQTKSTKKPCKCKALIEGDLDVNNIKLEDCKCTLKEREKIKRLIKNCECKNNPLNQKAPKPCKCKLDQDDEDKPVLDGLKKPKLENCMCTLKDLSNAKKMLRNCLCRIKKPCVCKVIKFGEKDAKKLKPEECECTLQDKENIKKLINNCMCKDNPLNKPPRKPCKCIVADGENNLKKQKFKDCMCTLKDKENAKTLIKNCLCKVKNPCKCKVEKDDIGSKNSELESCNCTLKDKQERAKSQLTKCSCLASTTKSKQKPCACKSGDSKDKTKKACQNNSMSQPTKPEPVKTAAKGKGDTNTEAVNPAVRCIRALRGLFGRQGDECGDGCTIAHTHSTNTDRPPTTSVATGEFQFGDQSRGKGLRVTSGIHLGIEFYKQIAPKEAWKSLTAVRSAPGLHSVTSTPGATYLPNAKPTRTDSSFDSFIRPKLAKQLKCTDDPKYLEKVRKFACKPGVCVPNTCIPNICYEIVKKRLGITANTKTRASECAIRSQFIPERTVKHKSSTTVWTLPVQGGKGDDNGGSVCPPGICELTLEYPECDPKICHDKLNNLERRAIKTERKSSLINICVKLSAMGAVGKHSLTKILGLCNLKGTKTRSRGSLTKVFGRCFLRRKSTQTMKQKRCFCVSKIKRQAKCTDTKNLSSNRRYQAKGSQSETIRHRLPFPGPCAPRKDEICQSYQSLMKNKLSQVDVSPSSATCMEKRLYPQSQESRAHVSLQTAFSRLPCPGGRKDVGVVCDDGICMPGECRPDDCAKKMNIKTSTHATTSNVGTVEPEVSLKQKDKTVQAMPEISNRVNKKMNITERDIAREYAPRPVATRKRRGCETDLSFQFEIRKKAGGFSVKPKQKQGKCTCLSKLDRTYGCAFCTTICESPFEYIAKTLEKTQPSTDITKPKSKLATSVEPILNNTPSHNITKRIKIIINYNA